MQDDEEDTLVEKEVDQRRDEVVRHMLNTPPTLCPSPAEGEYQAAP